MAQKVQVLLTDDLDGGSASQTIRFGWQGAEYEIDLSDKNAAAFEKAVTKYVTVSRKVSAGRAKRSSVASRSSKVDTGAVRVWARDNGYEVSDRGRVPAAVVEAYEASQR